MGEEGKGKKKFKSNVAWSSALSILLSKFLRIERDSVLILFRKIEEGKGKKKEGSKEEPTRKAQ